MQSTPLQEWANANDPSGSDLHYKGGFWEQVVFVRDTLPGIVYRMYDGNYETAKQVTGSLLALSTHTSKSVRLPVFHMTLPDGTERVMRYNFHDWKVSVKSPHEITGDFVGLFNPDTEIPGIYCEGFPKQWVFGSFSSNQQEFTLELISQYDVYMFFWLLVRNITSDEASAVS